MSGYSHHRPDRQDFVGLTADWRVTEPRELASCGHPCRVVRKDNGRCVRCWIEDRGRS